MALSHVELHNCGTHCPWFASASIVAALTLLCALPAEAQQRKRQNRPLVNPPSQSQFIPCAQSQQPLIQIPELVSSGGVLRGTIVLNDMPERLNLNIGTNQQCVPQFVRNFLAVNPTPAAYPGMPPVPAPPSTQPQYADPVPGPTLRAKVGDLVQLTFLNQINAGDYGDSIDRGERGQGCDETSAPYPGLDKFPDCFHGSSTGNIHFHGTHTSPSTTADDVFIEVRPSPRGPNGPLVTEASVQGVFGTFFAECTRQLDKGALTQWPKSWSDFPPALVVQQLNLLAQYDADPDIKNKLLPVDLKQWAAGAWPQYYIGAFPYCFRLPDYKEKAWPPAQPARPPAHGMMMEHDQRPLIMGQSPGTHWYHAHKHGSTTVNVANGMTGVFIVEGAYDDAFNQFYGVGWTGQATWARSQPVLVINQLGVSPNMEGGGTGPLPFSINGRFEPVITMQPGQVQLWRIANTASRGGIFFSGFAPAANPTVPSSPQVFAWKQTAQDGVQFNGWNYQNSKNPALLLFAGNRADLLVKAPTTPGQYVLLAQQLRSRCAALLPNQIPTIPTLPPITPAPTPICSPDDTTPVAVLAVNVTGTPATGNQAQFIPEAQLQASFPLFLQDIADNEVTGTKTVVFESTPTSGGPPQTIHTIDGHKFDGNVGEVVMLNTVEEWKIINQTVNGAVQGGKVVKTDPPGVVDHPFHIHINPFQIVEFFDPNEVLPGTSTYKYVFAQSNQPPPLLQPGQCLLFYDKPETWKACAPAPKTNLIWWDVFAIPSARAVFINNNTQSVTVPGYFKMRSRFVDFTGQYVMHCHILAHEDRGMMTVVEVVPFTTAYSHQ